MTGLDATEVAVGRVHLIEGGVPASANDNVGQQCSCSISSTTLRLEVISSIQ